MSIIHYKNESRVLTFFYYLTLSFLLFYILKHILLRLGAITPVFGDPSEIILICWFDAQEIFNMNYYQWQLCMLLNVVYAA